MAKCRDGGMPRWRNVKVAKCWDGETPRWRNAKMMRPLSETLHWQGRWRGMGACKPEEKGGESVFFKPQHFVLYNQPERLRSVHKGETLLGQVTKSEVKNSWDMTSPFVQRVLKCQLGTTLVLSGIIQSCAYITKYSSIQAHSPERNNVSIGR